MPSNFPLTLAFARDFALTLSGDLLLGSDGDLDTVIGEDVLLQEIIVRLETKKGDAKYAKEMGASLDTLIGRANSPGTQQVAEKLIMSALTHDGLFAEEDLVIIAFPSSETTISLTISCNMSRYGGSTSGDLLSLEITLDLQEGLLL